MTAVLIALAMFLLLATLVAYGRAFRTSRPPIEFSPPDASEVDRRLEEVRAKLAARDTAAFAIYPTGDVDRDADGQIWMFAAADGVLDRISIELALPESVTDPATHPRLALFVDGGWEVQEVEPGQWVLLNYPGLASPQGLASEVAAAIADLFDVQAGMVWRCRAIA